VVTETDIGLRDGRILHAYDAGPAGALPVFWLHGTPNVGAPPEPLFAAAAQRGLRWVSYDRPGYGGSTEQPGRTVASAAADIAAVADGLGIGRFAVLGSSGGGPHALACGALLAERVVAAVSAAGLAPFDAEGLDCLAGMAESAAAEMRAAAAGRAELVKFLDSAEFDENLFTPADWEALSGPWSWLARIAAQAMEAVGMVDDDLAFVAPWGFEPGQISVPVLLMHGEQDRCVPSAHSKWLARRCRSAEVQLYADDGHVSVLNSAADALDWICALA